MFSRCSSVAGGQVVLGLELAWKTVRGWRRRRRRGKKKRRPCPGPWWDPLCHGGTLCPTGPAQPFRGVAAISGDLSSPTQHFVL